jgi:hypothetical protein
VRRPFSLLIAMFLSGCLAGEQHTVERTLTSTVTLSRESVLEVNLPIPMVLDGASRTNDVVINVDLTVTASSSSAAIARADEIEIVTMSEQGVLRVGITEPMRVALGGIAALTMPGDLDVVLTERGSTVDVVSIEGDIVINSLSHVRVVGATSNVSVAIETGNALVQTESNPGKQTVIQLKRGDIELTLPPAVSADIEADVLGNGNIVIAHPRLPRYPGGTLPYRATVAGGLSIIRLQTGAGLIVIKSQ